MLKTYNHYDELDKDILTADDDFVQDARVFLQDRVGIDDDLSSGEVFDRFMEHMRFQDANEITALRDLEYAQNADLAGKQRFGRLIDAYDKVDDFGGRALLDYAEAVAFAPSTYAGIITGGTGKLASVAATQAAKLGTRKLLSQSLKSAAKNFSEQVAKRPIASAVVGGAAVEGTIGTGTGAVQEFTRVETDLQDEFEGVRTLTQGGLSALGGGLVSGAFAKMAAKTSKVPGSAQQRAAEEMKEKGRIAKNRFASVASDLSKETIAKNPNKAKKFKEVLNALDVNKVAEGRALRKDLSPSDTLEAALGVEVIENITAAAIRVADELKIKEGDRITTSIFNAINDGTVEVANIDSILREHNLSLDQFSLIYMSEISDAARKLQMAGQVKKARKFSDMVKKDAQLKGLANAVDGLSNRGASTVTADDAGRYVTDNKHLKVLDKLGAAVREGNRFGIASMTVQPATTMRNTIGGGFRVAVDATTRVMDNTVATIGNKMGLDMKAPDHILSGSADIAKYLLNPAESKVVRELLRDDMPNEIERLFREGADIYAKSQAENGVAKLGRKMNILNTASDNLFKQAVLAGSLKRRLKDEGIDLAEAIEQGVFDQIPNDVIQKSINDAYEFTYQSSFRGPGFRAKAARAFIRAPEELPAPLVPIYSAFMPFPRFVANQLKFQYEHAPVIGMLELLSKDADKPKIFAKQLTGTMMLSTALAWRTQQGPDAEWFDIKTGEDEYINGKAIYGPMAPFMVAADIIYRNFNKDAAIPENEFRYYSRAFIEATLGSTFRTGVGLTAIEPIYNMFSGKRTADERVQLDIAEGVGNYIGRYGIPAGVLKDLYSQFDEEARMIPATRTGEENWLELVYNTATRNLPDIGTTLLPKATYDQPAYSPYKTGPLQSVHPIEKQLFGATTMKKSPLQKEMSRLGMEYRDLYKIFPDKKVDFYVRQELSRPNAEHNMNEFLTKIVRTAEYQKSSPARQRELLTEYAKQPMKRAREIASVRLRAEAKRKGMGYSQMEIASWEKLSTDEKAIINEQYKELFGGNTVQEDKDRYIYMNDGTTVNVMMWAVSAADKLKNAGLTGE